MNRVVALMRADLAQPPPAGLEPLVERLRGHAGGALRAIVLYGSCRRSDDLHDGLVDLMAVVSDYRSVHGLGLSAAMNRLLPPNVYYAEAGPDDARLRSKYIVVSEDDFRRRTRGGLEPYFWARFTQPCRLVWAADDRAAATLAGCRARAAGHFARRARRLGAFRGTASSFWARAIGATYGCEIRPEPPGNAERLVARDPEFWDALSETLLPEVEGIEFTTADDVRVTAGAAHSMLGRTEWWIRAFTGKAMNIMRLIKAAGTFSNGLDYLAWKIERHSGQRVETTERMRRHPRLAAWGLLFRLWRSGAFR